MPAAIWLDLARAAEAMQRFEVALKEFERLAAAHPRDPQGLQALLGAARCSQRLEQPEQAIKFYEAAQASPVPHLDIESTIVSGIRQAKQMLAAKSQPASAKPQVVAAGKL
jgi:tetratricopeptide (TPR) repeat protein